MLLNILQGFAFSCGLLRVAFGKDPDALFTEIYGEDYNS